jgi:hypothetical protein
MRSPTEAAVPVNRRAARTVAAEHLPDGRRQEVGDGDQRPGMGFLVAHMAGNLKMYLGATELNHYAEGLRVLGAPFLPREVALWGMRGGMIVALLVHIHAAFSLTMMNRRAHPQAYRSKRDYIAANFASRTMRWTGPIVLLFILYHLADLTGGRLNPTHGEVTTTSSSRSRGRRWRRSRPREPRWACTVPRRVEPVPSLG